MSTSTIQPGARTAAAIVIAAALTGSALFAQSASGPAAALPAPVLKAFQQAYPGATISATRPARDGNRAVLRVDSVDKGRQRTVLYAPDGAVVQVSEQVHEQELPAPVLAAMRSHRRAIFVEAAKVTRGRNVEYHLTVRGSRRTRMVAKPDGTVVSFE